MQAVMHLSTPFFGEVGKGQIPLHPESCGFRCLVVLQDVLLVLYFTRHGESSSWPSPKQLPCYLLHHTTFSCLPFYQAVFYVFRSPLQTFTFGNVSSWLCNSYSLLFGYATFSVFQSFTYIHPSSLSSVQVTTCNFQHVLFPTKRFLSPCPTCNVFHYSTILHSLLSFISRTFLFTFFCELFFTVPVSQVKFLVCRVLYNVRLFYFH